MLYLDNHATTKLDGAVLDAMMPFLTDEYGNASSTHRHGVVASVAIDEAREIAAQTLSALKSDIYFTSGATESNNTVLKGVFLNAMRRGIKKPHFIISSIEHKCILESAHYLETLGAEVTYLDVDKHGKLDLQNLESSIKPTTLLVSVMAANNEIGVINPLRQIVDIVHKHGVLIHTDAAQAIGKIPLDITDLGLDLLSSSAHKHYGPKGVGILYVSRHARQYVDPLLHGGGQESGMRSGTSNTPGIVGLGESMRLYCQYPLIEAESKRQKELAKALYDGIMSFAPNLKLNGPRLGSTSRLPNNLNITMPTINEKVFIKKIKGLMISSGSACSSTDIKPSYVLSAIGLSDEFAFRSFRFGIGKDTTMDDVESALDIMKAAYQVAKMS